MPSLVSNWDLDGFVDEQRYYCSETPINTDSLPTPKSTLLGDVRSYTDTVIDAGKTYYVCIGSVKNGVEKFSNEIEVLALTEYANTFLKLKSDVVDAGLHPKTFTNNGVTFTNSAAVFTGSQHIASNTKSPDFNFGTGDFTIELAMSLPASGGGNAVDLRNLYGNTNNLITSDYANLVIVDTASVSWSNGSVWRTANFSFTIGQLYSIAITRESGVLRIFIDGVKLLEVYDTTNIAGDRYAHIGVGRLQDGSYEGWFKGSLKKLRVTKGIAKYTANYSLIYQN